MLKVLYLTPYFPYPPQSGGIASIWSRIKMFYKMGAWVDLVSVTNKTITADNVAKVKEYVRTVTYKRRENGVKLAIKAIIAAIEKQSLFLSLIPDAYAESIELLLNNNQYDIVMCEHTYLGYWFIKNFPQQENKVNVLVQNLEYDWYRYMFLREKNFFKKIYYGIEQRAFKTCEQVLFKSNSRFLFLSKTEMQRVNDEYNNHERCTLVPAVTVCRQYNMKLQHKERENKVLFVARMDSERNISAIKFFIEKVFPQILKEASDVELRIIGRGDDGSFTNYVNNINICKSIKFLGEIERLDCEYNQAKIVIIPILEAIGVQTKLFEAINYGSLIVSTAMGVKGSIFDDGTGVVIAKNDKEFSESCISILNNEFDIDSKIAEVENLFEKYGENIYIKLLLEFNNLTKQNGDKTYSQQ